MRCDNYYYGYAFSAVDIFREETADADHVLSAIALAMSAVPYIIMTFNVFTVIISALLAAVLVISVVMQIKHE